MRTLISLLALLVGCAHVDYELINARYDVSVKEVNDQYWGAVNPLHAKYKRAWSALQDRCRAALVEITTGTIVTPVMTQEMHEWVWACQDLDECDARQKTAAADVDTLYNWAPDEARQRAAEALLSVAPSMRLEVYERILAEAHNAEVSRRCLKAQDALTVRYKIRERELAARRDQDLMSCEMRRSDEIVQDQARVDAENSETAAAIAVGVLAVGAAAAVASQGNGGGGYTAPKDKLACGPYMTDLRGCCSWHGGINAAASRYLVICNDGVQSPTCECY